MATIIYLPPNPGLGAALGQGFVQGLNIGLQKQAQLSLQEKLLEARALAKEKQEDRGTAALVEHLSGNIPEGPEGDQQRAEMQALAETVMRVPQGIGIRILDQVQAAGLQIGDAGEALKRAEGQGTELFRGAEGLALSSTQKEQFLDIQAQGFTAIGGFPENIRNTIISKSGLLSGEPPLTGGASKLIGEATTAVREGRFGAAQTAVDQLREAGLDKQAKEIEKLFPKPDAPQVYYNAFTGRPLNSGSPMSQTELATFVEKWKGSSQTPMIPVLSADLNDQKSTLMIKQGVDPQQLSSTDYKYVPRGTEGDPDNAGFIPLAAYTQRAIDVRAAERPKREPEHVLKQKAIVSAYTDEVGFEGEKLSPKQEGYARALSSAVLPTDPRTVRAQTIKRFNLKDRLTIVSEKEALNQIPERAHQIALTVDRAITANPEAYRRPSIGSLTTMIHQEFAPFSQDLAKRKVPFDESITEYLDTRIGTVNAVAERILKTLQTEGKADAAPAAAAPPRAVGVIPSQEATEDSIPAPRPGDKTATIREGLAGLLEASAQGRIRDTTISPENLAAIGGVVGREGGPKTESSLADFLYSNRKVVFPDISDDGKAREEANKMAKEFFSLLGESR